MERSLFGKVMKKVLLEILKQKKFYEIIDEIDSFLEVTGLKNHL